MSFIDIIFFILEILGIVAFAISGCIVAIQKHFDIFGALMLGIITSVGGGLIRDIILGNIPPSMFTDPTYVVTATITSLIVFVLCWQKKLSIETLSSGFYAKLINTMDSWGLGLFTVIGVNSAKMSIDNPGFFLSVSVGLVTGIGGGMMRDVLAGKAPDVLHKHIYALASLSGAIIYYFLSKYDDTIALIFSVGVILLIRHFAMKYEWNMPRG